jgi:molybdenum cofactor cytidylyltransferase
MLGGRPLLEWPLAALRRFAPAQLVAVLGYEAEAIMRVVDLHGVDVVINRHFALGLSTSLQAGLARMRPEIEAVIITLGDQPLVTDDLFRLLEARSAKTGRQIVATDYGEYQGAPVLLHRSAWPLIESIGGDQGVRALLRTRPDLVTFVPVPDARMAIDVDSMARYEEAVALVERDKLRPPSS